MMAVFAFTHSPIPKVCVSSLAGPLAMVKCFTSCSFLHVPPPAAPVKSHTHTHTSHQTEIFKSVDIRQCIFRLGTG